MQGKKFISFFCVFLIALSVFGQEKPDALQEFRKGRQYDFAGRTDDARAAYQRAVAICQRELKANPKDMEAYVVYTWSLYRLKKYAETKQVCQEALKISSDARIIETLGETNFYLGRLNESLQNMQTYVDRVPMGARTSVAYFFIGEIYRFQEKYNKADIAYTHAVHLEPNLALWWYRLGSVREAAGNTHLALSAYERALKIDPKYKAASDSAARLSR